MSTTLTASPSRCPGAQSRTPVPRRLTALDRTAVLDHLVRLDAVDRFEGGTQLIRGAPADQRRERVPGRRVEAREGVLLDDAAQGVAEAHGPRPVTAVPARRR